MKFDNIVLKDELLADGLMLLLENPGFQSIHREIIDNSYMFSSSVRFGSTTITSHGYTYSGAIDKSINEIMFHTCPICSYGFRDPRDPNEKCEYHKLINKFLDKNNVNK